MASAQHPLAATVIQVFANPVAGGFDGNKLHRLITALEHRGARTIISYSEPGAALTVAPHANLLCSFGGDGTTRHVAAAATKCPQPRPLSVFPAGTVNLLAREMIEYRAALHAETDELVLTPHYIGRIGDDVFLTCVSVGPDSHVVANVSLALKRWVGKYAYAVSFLKQCLRWKRDKISLRWDDGETVCEALYVAKGKYYAGPWSFAPSASVKQPLLHVVALPSADRWTYVKFMIAVVMNRVDSFPKLERFTCTWLEVKSEAALPVQADGDIVTRLPTQIRVEQEPMPFFDIGALASDA